MPTRNCICSKWKPSWVRHTTRCDKLILETVQHKVLESAAQVLTPLVESRWGAMIGKDVFYTAMRNIRAITLN